MTIAILLIIFAVLPLAGWAVVTEYQRKKKAQQAARPPDEILTELVFRLMLQDDDAGAIAVFCAYRALTMPDRRGLAAVMAAEVDRRYGTRVPWPQELRYHVKLLLDEYYADELSRIEADIRHFKKSREQRELRDQNEATLASSVSAW